MVNLTWPGSLVAFLILLLLGACTDAVQPELERELSVIIEGDSESGTGLEVVSPDTVQAGATFLFRFRTYAGGCEVSAGTEVEASPSTLEVFPYTRVKDPAAFCTDALRSGFRSVELVFPHAGEALVILHGRSKPDDLKAVAIPISIIVE